jgi:hypothetical protein
MIIQIKPIDKENPWHGKTGADNFSRPKRVGALVDGKTMKYKTGLSEEDIKRLKEHFKVDYDLSNNYNDEKSHPFWDTRVAKLTLEPTTIHLDVKNVALDFIKHKIALESRFIANSMEEYENNKWPDATHVIYDENEEIEIKASKTAIKNKAIIESSKLNIESKLHMIMIISKKDLRDKSPNFVEAALGEICEETETAERLIQLINMDKEETSVRSLIIEALMKGVLVTKGHRIEYKGSSIAEDRQELLNYLLKDANQSFRLRLEEEVKN